MIYLLKKQDNTFEKTFQFTYQPQSYIYLCCESDHRPIMVSLHNHELFCAVDFKLFINVVYCIQIVIVFALYDHSKNQGDFISYLPH